MTLIQVNRGLINLYYGLGRRKETNLPQHAWCVELSPSTLNLWKAANCTTPNQILSTQARLNPTSYKNPKCQTNSPQVAYNILGKETTRSLLGSVKRPLMLASSMNK